MYDEKLKFRTTRVNVRYLLSVWTIMYDGDMVKMSTNYHFVGEDKQGLLTTSILYIVQLICPRIESNLCVCPPRYY